MRRLIFIFALLCSPAFAATHYVWCGASGSATGADFTNAKTTFPTSGTLVRGDTYVVAGTVSCTYPSYIFNDVDSGTTVITIRKAQASLDSGVAGWQASFGTAVADWTDTPQADPLTGTNATWQFCSDYYTIDGITGNTDPITGPSGQGFKLGTQNKKIAGIINIGNAGCANNPAGLTDLSFSHLDVGGTAGSPAPYFPAAVTSCSYSGGNATIGIGGSLGGIVGDVIAGWTSAGAIVFQNIANSSISSSQVIVPLGSTPCATLAFVALDFFPGYSFFITNNSNLNETFTNITIQTSYLHDEAEAIRVTNGYTVNILNNYTARNRFTPTQHGSMIQVNEGANATVSGPVTIAYNFTLDPSGTATYVHLGQPTACGSNCGTINGYYIYGNIITCDAGTSAYTSPGCGAVGTISDNGGQNIVQNALFYGNTIANQPGPVGVNLTNAGSTATAENNIFYNITGTNAVRLQANGGLTFDYNMMLNSTLLFSITCQTHDFCTTSGTADPFVNDAIYNFKLLADQSGATTAGNITAQGLALSAPYNLDFLGNTRGVDGTWERGAYEFSSVASTPTFSGGTIIPQTVTITCSTGPTACYNFTGSPVTDGTTGCTTGTLYSAPLSVAIPETLYAVCGGTGFTDGSVGTKTFIPPTAAAPGMFASMSGPANPKELARRVSSDSVP